MSRAIAHLIEIDNSGFQYTGVIYVSGWYIVTSGNTASVTIEDVNHVRVIRGVSAITSERMIPGPPLAKPVRIQNLKVLDWTNIERVIIFIDKFGAE